MHDRRAFECLPVNLAAAPYTPLTGCALLDLGYVGGSKGGKLKVPIDDAAIAAEPALKEVSRQQAGFRVVVEHDHGFLKGKFKIIAGIESSGAVLKKDIPKLIITVWFARVMTPLCVPVTSTRTAPHRVAINSHAHSHRRQLFGLANRLRRVEGGKPLRTEQGLIWIGLSKEERASRGYAFDKVENKF